MPGSPIDVSGVDGVPTEPQVFVHQLEALVGMVGEQWDRAEDDAGDGAGKRRDGGEGHEGVKRIRVKGIKREEG
jgi:hypothetical protein